MARKRKAGFARAKVAKGRRRKPFRLKLKRETVYTFSSILLFLVGGIIVLSFSRQGFLLSRIFYELRMLLGWGVIFLPFFFFSAGLMLSRLKWEITKPNVFVGTLVFLVSLVALTQAGKVGGESWQTLALLVSPAGAFLIFLGFTFIGFVITFNTSLEEILLFIVGIWLGIKKIFTTINKIRSPRLALGGKRIKAKIEPAGERRFEEPALMEKSAPEAKGEAPGPAIVANLPARNTVWEFPPLSLLEDKIGGQAERGDVNKNADIIEKTLESFGVSANVVEVNYGPAVTQYALEIALGTKLSKITALSNDLAMALAAPTGQIRIEAPIPGRSLVGVEVPNRTPEFVPLKRMLLAEVIKRSKSKLAVGLGLNVAGQPVATEIDRMPHVLIAGATGSGKSVCINSFICMILFRATPDEVKMILVDPKRVELTQYNGIPHLLTPVITDPSEVLSALKWAVQEMEKRYKLFAEVGVRNIQGYNELAGFTALPLILIFVDELADIILFSPAEVEDTICRIAQMARATGIHLAVSTQRPSVDVITGLIKANIPCRIAFNVSSQVDSRVILDTIGAEKLLGRGDMLYIPPDQAKPSRIQGTYVSEPEIQRIIQFLKKTGVTPVYTEEVTQAAFETGEEKGGEVGEMDEFFAESLRTICQFDRASASLLQRRLKIGYNRAARILDQMERAGLIGPADGAKPREVLVKDAEAYLASRKFGTKI